MDVIVYTQALKNSKILPELFDSRKILVCGTQSDLLSAVSKNDNSIVILYEKAETATVVKHVKNLNQKVPVLVLRPHPSLEEGMQLLGLGIKGYASDTISKEHLAEAIGYIEEKNIWLYPEFIQAMIMQTAVQTTQEKEVPTLSVKELQTARLVAKGLSNKEIASEMDITLSTVKTHIKAIFTKLEVKDRLSIALYMNE